MSVVFGSARSSYGNTTRGDQHGGLEVSTQAGYLHSKGWRVFRAKKAEQRMMLAVAMRNACYNDHIGYSQPDRLSLISWLGKQSPACYDPATVTVDLNCDCSSLVRVCCYYAGIKPKDFITSGESGALMATGAFEEVQYRGLEYLAKGDILVTKTKGHTVIVIKSGSKCSIKEVDAPEVVTYRLGDRDLCNGCEGDDVRELQRLLIDMGYSCGEWGLDGEFGDATEYALRMFQSDHGMVVDGILGRDEVQTLIDATGDDAPEDGTQVKIFGGRCYVRDEPNVTGEKIGVVNEGMSLVFANEVSEDGWIKVVFGNTTGWVSGKYGRRV